MLTPLEVIWIWDGCISPPGPKMVVCIEPELGLFFRINTKPWQTAVKLERDPDHQFLDHDSYLECGEPLELDDFVIEESLRERGVIGVVSGALVGEIFAVVREAKTLTEEDKERIRLALGE